MINNKILTAVFSLISLVTVANAATWELTQPGTANIHEGVSVSHSRLGLYVPKSFEGRKAKENRNTYTVELRDRVRLTHSDAEVKLTGMVNKMNFDYKSDVIDIQVFRSKDMRSSSSSCLDCHREESSRTMAIIGYGITKADDFMYSGEHFVKSESKYFKAAIDHWMRENLMLRSEIRIGNAEQGSISNSARSFSIGLGGIVNHRLTWSGDYIYTKVSSFSARNIIVGRLAYTLLGGLKLKFEAGAFLDGYAQFGSNMTEMGLAIMEPVKKYSNSLPSIFEKLKNDKFGYYNACIEYEYRF